MKTFGGKSYDINMFNISEHKFEELKEKLFFIAVSACFTQMTATKGIKLFGDMVILAIYKEYKQFMDLNVLGALDLDQLTNHQKRAALRAINIIKLKQNGKIKARTCTDGGSTQREFVPKEEASSPTLFLESQKALLLINTFEGRNVAIFDVCSRRIRTCTYSG